MGQPVGWAEYNCVEGQRSRSGGRNEDCHGSKYEVPTDGSPPNSARNPRTEAPAVDSASAREVEGDRKRERGEQNRERRCYDWDSEAGNQKRSARDFKGRKRSGNQRSGCARNESVSSHGALELTPSPELSECGDEEDRGKGKTATYRDELRVCVHISPSPRIHRRNLSCGNVRLLHGGCQEASRRSRG